MSVLLEFSMFPTDKGTSVSEWVARVLDEIDRSQIPYQLTPMGTIIETENLAQALRLVEAAYGRLEGDCERVYSSLKIDIRKGPPGRLQGKTKSLQDKLGRELQT
ncbi:MAG: MTH1187 family thiamine-binding protein [Leptospiraceae bacterium]|nr:MTH1187 family thiamine-binding protein [Leptospiraceae bacterium]